MFSNLRQGTLLYVLYKNEPEVSIGEVESISAPFPLYGATYNAGYLQPTQMYVDVKLKVCDETIDLQKLPADQTTADFGTNGMVVSESREDILREIEVLRKNSQSILDSVPHHKEVLQKAQQLIEQLNPRVKAEAEQRRDIDALKSQMSNIETMLSKLLSKSKKED